jgi:hypothetical protein
LDQHELSGFIDSLAQQLRHDLPQFAASAVTHHAPRPSLAGANTR